jgi:predicted ATPase/DNA-binding XRE family transcriptional regulator
VISLTKEGERIVSVDRISPLFGSSFGALLRRYREAAGLTQEELAERAGLSVRGISDLERGLRQTPRRDTVELLADALELPSHLRALLAAAARPAGPGTPRPHATMPAIPHNLPAQLTPLLGRERETRQAVERLSRADVRLLTLTGPGGVGKTRLALAVAESLLGDFEDGVYFIPLASLRDPQLVWQVVAEALSLRITDGQPLAERLRQALRERRTLLLFDNFEHLLAATPEVVALLESCPQVKALMTSREPLKLAGEHELSIEPLAEDAAAQLFIERARAVRPDFAPAAADVPLIAAICQRVDRLPLAIELAASWVRVLALPALLDRLERRLELLSAGRRDAPERQRTLRGAIAWSADLLNAPERRLFQRLAIFVGGCELEAAQAVCRDLTDEIDEEQGQPSAEDTLDVLARVVEKHLLRAEIRPPGPRFSLLETIREYALERLTAAGELESLGRRHAEYYAQMATDLGWIGPEQDARDVRLERELPNARAALAWALRHDEPGLGLRLATPLGRWWYSRGAFDEAERWLRAFLELDTDLDAHASVRSAPPPLRGTALFELTLIALDRRHYDEAEALAHEGLALAERHGDDSHAGNMLAELGHVAEARGDLDAAMRYFEQGLARTRQGSGGAAIGRTLSSLGNLARARGDYLAAQDYLEQALAWARERQFGFAIASGLTSLGHVACELGEYARAAALYRESLDLYATLRNPTALAWCLCGVVITLAAAGQPTDDEAAAQLCGAIDGLRAAASADETAEWAPFARASEQARKALGEERFAAAQAAGRALSAEQAIAVARAALPTSAGG